MPLSIIDGKRPTSEAELDALEMRLGIKLPTEYRRFLLAHNGGRPVPKAFSFTEKGAGPTQSTVAWFLAVHDGPYSNFENTFRTFKVVDRRMPDNLVPIADDPFGNEICISNSGHNVGKIYFWDHEAEGDRATYDNCYLIADSLEQFLDGLHELRRP